MSLPGIRLPGRAAEHTVRMTDDPPGTVILGGRSRSGVPPAPSVQRANEVIRRMRDAFDVFIAPAFTTRLLDPVRFS